MEEKEVEVEVRAAAAAPSQMATEGWPGEVEARRAPSGDHATEETGLRFFCCGYKREGEGGGWHRERKGALGLNNRGVSNL